MAGRERKKRRGLSREAIVARALEIGNAGGLDAVSIRRLAQDFDVTPMALYRHVKDKQDLVNAMTELIMEGIDLTAGFRPSMTWTERVRRAMTNFRAWIDARPLALPLSIAYSGEGPPGFWRMSDDLLGILLEAGFTRREAVVLIRVVSNLLSGYLLLQGEDDPALRQRLEAGEVELIRKRMELTQLSLPRDEFPNIVASARDMADVWLSNPDRWWQDTMDVIVFGLESMLERRRRRSGVRSRPAS
ncbi:MAG TPA: TetR family transcriptional regulator [Candidatus Dormibacteraeota bacterium]|nr:TetR family transcriptional regulator [Candidatus Dormibacteraeota bacterium]